MNILSVPTAIFWCTSYDKCTYCKSLCKKKASAKCPKCKCKLVCINVFLMISSSLIKGISIAFWKWSESVTGLQSLFRSIWLVEKNYLFRAMCSNRVIWKKSIYLFRAISLSERNIYFKQSHWLEFFQCRNFYDFYTPYFLDQWDRSKYIRFISTNEIALNICIFLPIRSHKNNYFHGHPW